MPACSCRDLAPRPQTRIGETGGGDQAGAAHPLWGWFPPGLDVRPVPGGPMKPRIAGCSLADHPAAPGAALPTMRRAASPTAAADPNTRPTAMAQEPAHDAPTGRVMREEKQRNDAEVHPRGCCQAGQDPPARSSAACDQPSDREQADVLGVVGPPVGLCRRVGATDLPPIATAATVNTTAAATTLTTRGTMRGLRHHVCAALSSASRDRSQAPEPSRRGRRQTRGRTAGSTSGLTHTPLSTRRDVFLTSVGYSRCRRVVWRRVDTRVFTRIGRRLLRSDVGFGRIAGIA